MEYGGFVVIDDVKRAPDRGCYNCKNNGNCAIYETLNDDARISRLPWKCWEKARRDNERETGSETGSEKD